MGNRPAGELGRSVPIDDLVDRRRIRHGAMIATAEQNALRRPAPPPESTLPEALPETGLSESRLGEAYWDFIRGLRMRQARIGYLLALGLVPAALSLDAFVYPELLRPILKSRMICDLALLPCFIALFRPFGLRHIHWL